MKITRAARRMVRIRFTTLCLLVLAIAGLELGLSQFLGRALELSSARQVELTEAPSAAIGDFFSAVSLVR